MSYSVWKFPIPIYDEFCIEMPQGARLLRVDMQLDRRDEEEHPMLWAVVPVEAPKVKRWFRLMGTGHYDTARIMTLPYVGSLMMNDGLLVFHVFDVGESPLDSESRT